MKLNGSRFCTTTFRNTCLKSTLIASLLALVSVSCALYDLNDLLKEPVSNAPVGMIDFSGNSLTLAWDPPDLEPEDSSIEKYQVLYRELSTTDWKEIAEIDAISHPQHTIKYSILKAGSYEFGVIAIDAEEQRSNIHSSRDRTAEPETGWYIKWERR